MAAPAIDPALPGSDPVAGARRLAAGDWVFVSGPAPSLQGIGKIVDGEYAPRDAVLLQARVELARGSFWFSPTSLARVEPRDEVHVCEEALARGVVPGERAARLRADLESFARGSLGYVRSPGLLDRLWAALGDGSEPRPVGLVALFEDGASVVLAGRRRALPAFATPPDFESVAERTRRVPARPFRVPTTPAEARVARDALLEALLGTLNKTKLRELAEVAGIELAGFARARELRRDIAASNVPLATVAEALTQRQLALASPFGDVPSLMAAIHSIEPVAPAEVRAELPPSERAVLAVTLATLERGALARVADELFVPFPETATADDLRERLAAVPIELGALLESLDDAELARVCIALALPTGGDTDAVRERIRVEDRRRNAEARVREAEAREREATRVQAERAPPEEIPQARGRPAAPEPALVLVLRALDLDALRRIAEGCGVDIPEHAPAPHVRAHLVNEDVPIGRALMLLATPELVQAAAALALPTDGPRDALVARLLIEDARRAAMTALVTAAAARIFESEEIGPKGSPERPDGVVLPASDAAVEAATLAAPPPEPVPTAPISRPRLLAQLPQPALVKIAEACSVPTWDGPSEEDLRARLESADVPLDRALAPLSDHELRDLALALGLPGHGTAEELRRGLLRTG